MAFTVTELKIATGGRRLFQLRAMLTLAQDADIANLVELCQKSYNASETSIRTLAGAHFGQFLSSSIRCAMQGGEIFVASEQGDTSGAFRGLSIWWPPGCEAFSTPEQQEIFHEFVSKLTPDEKDWHQATYRPKFGQLTNAALGPRGKLASYYLSLLAVEPEYQRRGIARALISAVGSKANGAELTLAATNETNVRIYKQLGFVVRAETTMDGPYGAFPVFVLSSRAK
ncbi:N-acetyltransferase domain-containing protein [Mycena kentingensis (nom. inval.)]|nr:N-acetyltransferase domain-containing protein [Mycena kentingensis (nom. inval.)]